MSIPMNANEQVAALSAAIESTFLSAVIIIQIYNKVSVNHKTAALKQTRVMGCKFLNLNFLSFSLSSFFK
jgi:hypothetical protein